MRGDLTHVNIVWCSKHNCSSPVEEKLQNVQVAQVHLNCTTFQKGILGAGTRKLRICGYLPKLMKSIICSDYDDVAMNQSERATRRDCTGCNSETRTTFGGR